jgi:hypothetical protein
LISLDSPILIIAGAQLFRSFIWVALFFFLFSLSLFFSGLGAAYTKANQNKQNTEGDGTVTGPNCVIGLVDEYFFPGTQQFNVLHLIAELKFTFFCARLKLCNNYNALSPLRLDACAHSSLTVVFDEHGGFVATVAVKHININPISNLNEGSNGRCRFVELL